MDRERVVLDTVCLSDGNEAYAEEIRAVGLDAYPMEMERYAINIVSDLRLMWTLWRFVRKQQYDVILGHGSKAGFIVRFVGRLSGVPAVYGLASMSFIPRMFGRKAYLYRALEYLASITNEHIVVLSNATRRELRRLRIARESQITTIYTGIEYDVFSQPHDRIAACQTLGLDPTRPVVGWAQRFVRQKAPLDFLRAMLPVHQAIPGVQIFMAGEGKLKASAEAFARERNLPVTFAPWQDSIEIMLAALDVYVLSSHWEGLPLSLLEAMATGRPCVSTDVDGCKEVIEHGLNGYLTAMGAVDDIANHVITLLQDASLRAQIGEAAQARIESRFSRPHMIEAWHELFARLAKS